MKAKGKIQQTALSSPLLRASSIAPKGEKKGKSLAAAVILTSLIDAFSILVIYLLVNSSSSGEILYISKDLELPTAVQAQNLERTTLVKVDKENIYIEDKKVAANQLVAVLVDISKRLSSENETSDKSLIVQADKRLEYKTLNQIILAGSHAGFGEIRFAVLSN